MSKSASKPGRRGTARIDARLDKLYGDAHGFCESDAERDRLARAGTSSTYGELTTHGTAQLLDELKLGAHDRFVDLGSGIGRLVWQVAMSCSSTKAKRMAPVRGIEMVPSRHETALGSLARAQHMKWKVAERVRFERGNFLRADLSGTTVAYCCNTAFPDPLIDKLVRKLAKLEAGARFVSLMPLDDNPWFEVRRMIELDTTWRKRAKVRIYELVRPWGFSRRR